MPRPKRSKVAPSAPTVVFGKNRKEKISSASAVPRISASSAIPRHVSSPKNAGTNSDDSEGLVKRSRSGKNKKGIARIEARMSGALGSGLGNDESALAREERLRREGRIELLETAKGGNVNAAVAAAEPEVLVPSSLPEERGQDDAPVPRTAEKPAPVVSSMQNWRTQATPRADSSILSIANFKRRPRQPSILGIGRQDDSVTLSSLGGGSLGGEFEDDDLADFQPDDESTPFHVSKVRPQPGLYATHQQTSTPVATHQASSASRKRKITPPEVLIPGSRPSSADQNEMNFEQRPPAFNLPAEDDEELEDDDEPVLPAQKRRAVTPPPDVFSDTMAPPQSSSSPIQSVDSRLDQPVLGNMCATRRGRLKGTTTTTQETTAAKQTRTSKIKKQNSSNAVSTSTLQSLLPRRRTTRHRDHEFQIHSDSDADPFSYESSSPVRDEDEDELSFAPTARRGRTGAPTPGANTNGSKLGRTNGKARSKTKATSAALQPVTKNPFTSASLSKKTTTTTSSKSNHPHTIHHTNLTNKTATEIKTTYSSRHRRVSNKENADGPASPSTLPDEDDGNDANISSSIVDNFSPQKRKELDRLAAKFRDVDRWEMEFEEVTASSSSPTLKDAR